MSYKSELWYAVDKDGSERFFSYPIKRERVKERNEDGTEKETELSFWEVDVDWKDSDRRWAYTHLWNIVFPNQFFEGVRRMLPQITWDDEPIHFMLDVDVYQGNLDPKYYVNVLYASNADGSKYLYATNITRDKITDENLLRQNKDFRKYPGFWAPVNEEAAKDKKNPFRFIMPIKPEPQMIFKGIEWPTITWDNNPIPYSLDFKIELL